MTSGDVALERNQSRIAAALALGPDDEPGGDRNDGYLWTCRDCGFTAWSRWQTPEKRDGDDCLCWTCVHQPTAYRWNKRSNKSAAGVAAPCPQ